MKIVVNRVISNKESTLSTIHLNGEFECFGLEDEYREEKVAKETRIPAGEYQIGLRTWGGFHKRYSHSPVYGKFHEGMLQVLDVPGFTSILIHVGNDDDDTEGCLLVGRNAISTKEELSIGQSRVAYSEMYPKILEAFKNGEQVTIEYIDSDL